jgi:hypothetical protein
MAVILSFRHNTVCIEASLKKNPINVIRKSRPDHGKMARRVVLVRTDRELAGIVVTACLFRHQT